jgi:hypothetical protein
LRLLYTAGVKRNIALTLEAAFEVPPGAAVTNENRFY